MNTFEPAPPQPVRLTLPLTRPLLVWGLLGINIVMFIVETLVGGSDNSATLVTLGAKVNTLIVMGQYWRLITPMFLHIFLDTWADSSAGWCWDGYYARLMKWNIVRTDSRGWPITLHYCVSCPA